MAFYGVRQRISGKEASFCLFDVYFSAVSGVLSARTAIVYNEHKKYHHIQKIINFALVFYKKVLSKDKRKKTCKTFK